MDLILDYGDLSIEKTEKDFKNNSYYDLVIEDEEKSIPKLIRRTLETPLSYIGVAIKENSNILLLDGDYGNPLYRKLSEPFITSFIVEAQSDIESALNKIRDVPGLNFKKVRIINYTIDTLNIEVTYTYKNANETSQLSLNL